jgi:hypothetical protein
MLSSYSVNFQPTQTMLKKLNLDPLAYADLPPPWASARWRKLRAQPAQVGRRRRTSKVVEKPLRCQCIARYIPWHTSIADVVGAVRGWRGRRGRRGHAALAAAIGDVITHRESAWQRVRTVGVLSGAGDRRRGVSGTAWGEGIGARERHSTGNLGQLVESTATLPVLRPHS